MDNKDVNERIEDLFKIIEEEFVKIEQIFTILKDGKQKSIY